MDDQKLQQIIQQGIKEAHLSGLQAGKKETSDLVDEILHKLEETVDKKINGKLYKIMETQEAIIKEQAENKKIVNDYIITDLKWKDGADQERILLKKSVEKVSNSITDITPSVENMKMLSNTSTGITFILKSIIIIGSAVGVVYGLLKWIKN